MKHYILSHYDLDGIVSVINVYNIIKNKENFQYCLTGYTSLEKKINNLKNEEFDVLWILDMNLSFGNLFALAKVLSQKTVSQVIWIDHHEYEYDVEAVLTNLKNEFKPCEGVELPIKFIYDPSLCAALATNKFIGNINKKVQSDLEELSLITNTYDMWDRNNDLWKKAYALNDLFWEYKSDKFFLKFCNGYKLDQEDLDTIERVSTERDNYVKDTLNRFTIHDEDTKAVFIYNPECKYTNHFALVLYDVHYLVILKEYTKEYVCYSIRLYNPDLSLTVQEVFDRIKESGVNVLLSGGHSRVGSITIAYDDNEKFLETINKFFEGGL